MTLMLRARPFRSDQVFDSSCGRTAKPNSQAALVDDQTRNPVGSRQAVAPDRIVSQCVELIMFAQGFVFLVAALTMLAR